ncbi:MAG: DUF4199 domain-containing protein [Flavobacteriaceae bacterium]
MENQASSKSVILNYGLVLGILSILTSVVVYALDKHLDQDWRVSVLSFVVMIVIIVLGIRNFKTANLNLVTWGQAVKIGVGIAIIGALISIIYNLIFINFIEPDFMNQMLDKQRLLWEEANMSSDEIEASESLVKTFSNPALTSAIGIIAAAFFGFIISAIAGAIMKRTEEDGY